jgi:sodium transport system ATP-binding protein
LSADAVEAEIEDLVRRLNLSTVVDRRAKGYSQGERLKVALARVLVHRPQTIILDEPTNGLDVNAVRMLRELLRELRSAGRCILFSSHVMQEVAALCDDIVIISGGRVVVNGTPEQILEHTGTHDLEEAFVRVAVAEADA